MSDGGVREKRTGGLLQKLAPYREVYIYGLGQTTQKFLADFQGLTVRGLLDGLQDSGMVFGLPVVPLESLSGKKACIVVVARKASERIVVNRIREFCSKNNIGLFNPEGENLLLRQEEGIQRADFSELEAAIARHKYISFDIFGTLIYRTIDDREHICRYAVRNRKLDFDFPKIRLNVEFELSANGVPTIEDIYREIGSRTGEPVQHLKQLKTAELEAEKHFLHKSAGGERLLQYARNHGKKISFISDMYFSQSEIVDLLKACGHDVLPDEKIYISSECGRDKRSGLFEQYKQETGISDSSALHIGDDEECDIDAAKAAGIEAILFNGAESANTPFEIGYQQVGPALTAFTYWLAKKVKTKKYDRVLFIARDGYLVQKIYEKLRKIETDLPKSDYLLVSRTACIPAYCESEEDIRYVMNMMPYSSEQEVLSKRFGLEDENIPESASLSDYADKILKHSEEQRDYLREYLNTFGLNGKKIAIFDFASTGTVQMCLERATGESMDGYYFYHIPDFAERKKNLHITGFVNEVDTSDEFSNYFDVEPLIKEPVGTVRSYEADGTICMSECHLTSSQPDDVKTIQEGTLAYAEEMQALFGADADGRVSFIANDALHRLSCVSINQTKIPDVDEFSGRRISPDNDRNDNV